MNTKTQKIVSGIALAAAPAVAFCGIVLTGTVAAPAHASAATVETAQTMVGKRIPACVLEDGSTQKVCYWDGETMGVKGGKCFLNVDFGKKWTYLPCSALRKYVRTHLV